MFYLYFFFSILFSLVLLWTWNLCMAIWVQNVSQLQLQTEIKGHVKLKCYSFNLALSSEISAIFSTYYDSDWSFFFMGATSEARSFEGTWVFTLTLSFILEESITDPETMSGVKPETATHEMSLIVSTQIRGRVQRL